MKRKNREQKHEEYIKKFNDIPIDFKERLEWLYDNLNISESLGFDILLKRDKMLNNLFFYNTKIILFEVPEGAPRPRFRIINRKNISNLAINNPKFVHVYSITGAEDSAFMKRLMTQDDFDAIDQMICTPCKIDIYTYLKTPSSYNKEDIILSEIGIIRPITKPDWDNLGKRYSDMFNENIWLDDTLVIDGSVHRYYSVLPRVEIYIQYLNMLYNKNQYNNIINRSNYNDIDLDYFH